MAIRATYKRLLDTTEDIFFRLFPETDRGWVRFNRNERVARLKFETPLAGRCDIEVMFRALDNDDDVSKVLSINTTAAWFNEWSEVNQAIHNAVNMRLGRFPHEDTLMPGEEIPRGGYLLDYNPPDPDSWQHDFFEKDCPKDAKLWKYPSGRSEKALNTKHLKKGYYQDAAIGLSEAEIKRYIDGEYVSLTERGAVFTSYRDDTHTVQEDDVKYERALPLYLGFDFGMTPACIILQRDHFGRWLALDEMCEDSMDIVTFAPLLKSYLDIHYPRAKLFAWGDPSGEYGNEVDAGRTVYTVLQKHGIPARPYSSNDPSLRRIGIMTPLNDLVDGKPRLRVSSKCYKLLRALRGGYRHNDKGQIIKDQHSHPVDALGYALLGGGESGHRMQAGEFRQRTMRDGGARLLD